MVRAFIGLGANLGDAAATLIAAVGELAQIDGIKLLNTSYIYKTAPIGYEEQEWFYNGVAQVETTLEPRALLQILMSIEQKFHRKRLIRWGPRTLDLDLLLYGETKIDTLELTVPHPRMLERAFVMMPLADLIAEERLEGYLIKDIASKLAMEQEIIRTNNRLA